MPRSLSPQNRPRSAAALPQALAADDRCPPYSPTPAAERVTLTSCTCPPCRPRFWWPSASPVQVPAGLRRSEVLATALAVALILESEEV
jgi:hypothetical protein